MSKTYITLTGTQYYHGKDFLKPGMRVQYYSKHRNTWNGLNPVTRTVPNGKGYDRNKQKQEDRRSGRISYHENIYRIFLPCMQNNVPVARYSAFSNLYFHDILYTILGMGSGKVTISAKAK